MSAIIVCKTSIKDREGLLAALKEMGVPDACVEASADGTTTIRMAGFGRTAREVEVCVRKAFHNGYGDIGFLKPKKESAEYQMLIDDMDDAGRAARAVNATSFRAALAQHYSAAIAKRTLESEGYAVQTTKTEDGQVRLVAQAY